MFSKAVSSLALATLLFFGRSSARHSHHPRHNRRDDSSSSGNITSSNTDVTSSSGNSTSTSLQPVVPPSVNQDALDVLALGTNVTLAWAGSPTGSNSRRLLKRDGGVFSAASFTFAYPTVPLDHSNYISNVTCSTGSLTASLSDDAYSFAKKEWTGAGNIVFVTSADGCGQDNVNDMFKATSITFSDSDQTFTAQGSSIGYMEAANHMNLQWGSIGTANVKRAVDKRDMFEPPHLHRRAELDFSFSWGTWLNDILGTDDDAPWDNAAKLFEWSSEGGEEDDSYEKGEVAEPDGHHKRSQETSLATREDGEVSYGLALYCVECGFGGSAKLWGEIDASLGLFTIDVETVQCGFDASFSAGLNLGMEAYVKYEKEWEDELDRINLDGFDIPLLVDVGPFISVSLSATVDIEATGTLLIGAAVNWDAIEILIDLLDTDNSYANGLSPTFTHTAVAQGELSISASLGLPLKLGIGVDILDGAWTADAAIVDTPSIVAEGVFEVSASVGDDGEISTDINGGCYGIAWDIHFENTLQAVIEGEDIGSLTWDLIDPQESAPIAEGCIGYVDDGTDDNPETGSSTGETGNGMDSGGTGLSGSNGDSGSSSSSSAAPVFIAHAAQVGRPTTSPTSSPSTGTTATTTSPGTSTATTTSPAVKKAITTSPAVKKATTTSPAVKKATTTSAGTKKTTTTSAGKKTTTTSAGTQKATTLSTRTTSTTTSKATTAATCTPSKAIVNPSVPSGLTCKQVVKSANVGSKLDVGSSTTVTSVSACALECLQQSKCVSFGYGTGGSCQLYNAAVKSLGTTTKTGAPQLTFYDQACYIFKSCS